MKPLRTNKNDATSQTKKIMQPLKKKIPTKTKTNQDQQQPRPTKTNKYQDQPRPTKTNQDQPKPRLTKTNQNKEQPRPTKTKTNQDTQFQNKGHPAKVRTSGLVYISVSRSNTEKNMFFFSFSSKFGQFKAHLNR